MKVKPDDRRDNVDKIQQHINNTLDNIHKANDMIEITDDEKTKQDLKAKNERREETLSSLRNEIRDEALDKEKGYK
ncbi:small acid-soluble spore protein Tlp [Clostridium folliculivorans]|uniref:Protein Tlp homolog n=1 Tax=Clostridium folliculivorans TaxID=2886038 RepID=A0A9W6DBD4_9CLOT|nr:small acid-soluble spore protein Tlp [Clostridium folliculivorans]GKU26310.1 protein Tlp [Clostridium folliculivorans]GKU32135.1 protein Tlp [Clostridium folliculivorans]